jgi:glycosyltransferase involved in cell wall biosynthesis
LSLQGTGERERDILGNTAIVNKEENLNVIINAFKTQIPRKSDLSKPIVDVVLPVYNEAKTIREVISNFDSEIATKIPCRLVIAEDGSGDGTKEILKNLSNEIPISLYSGIQRKGYAKGVADALRKCTEDWIFFSDSDGQYLSSDFWRLWENRIGYDMIIGRKLRRSEGVHRTVLAKGFHNVANNLFRLNLHDADCGFRLIRKTLVDSILDDVKYLKYSFWAEFTIRSCLSGYRICEVPINHAMRMHGNTQIYSPSKIPLIILKQLNGLANLYIDTRKGN